MIPILLVPLGLLLGGLINLMADRLPTDGTLGRPRCPSCSAPRPARAWLAFSGMLAGGWTCHYCGRPFPHRHWIVELLAAAGTPALYLAHLGPSGFGPALLISAIFLLITVTDIEHRLILHWVSLPAIGVVTLLGVLDTSRGPVKTLLGGLAGFGIVLGLYLLGGLFSRWVASRRGQPLAEAAFGFGDVTLSTLIGVAVGWPGVLLALMIGVLTAGVFSLGFLLWMLLRGRYQPYLPIPYGPFLILGAELVYLGGRQLFLPLAG